MFLRPPQLIYSPFNLVFLTLLWQLYIAIQLPLWGHAPRRRGATREGALRVIDRLRIAEVVPGEALGERFVGAAVDGELGVSSYPSGWHQSSGIIYEAAILSDLTGHHD